MTEAREKFSELVNHVAYQDGRVLLSRHGNPVAALVPLADLKVIAIAEKALEGILDVREQTRQALRSTLDAKAMVKSLERGGEGVPLDEAIRKRGGA